MADREQPRTRSAQNFISDVGNETSGRKLGTFCALSICDRRPCVKAWQKGGKARWRVCHIGEGGHVGESNISSPVTVQNIYPSIEEVFHLLLVQAFALL